MSGNRNQRRNVLALVFSAALHVVFLAFVINETASPYALPETAPAPMEVQIVPEQEIQQPPPPPPIIPKTLREALRRLSQPPPPPAAPPAPTQPQIRPPAPVAPPRVTPPKPNPPTPAPQTPAPTPTPARTAPPKPNPLPAAPVPARAPAPPTPSPSPSPAPNPGPRPAPSVSVTAPHPTTARAPTPAVVVRPSLLNLHKPTREVPAGVPTLPLAPSGAPGGPAQAGGGGGGPGAPAGSRLGGLSPYPYGGLPSGGPGLRGTLVGCANAEAVRLSSVERARCNERFGEEADRAPVLDAIDPVKRSGFDKAADRQARQRNAGMPVGTAPGAQGFGGLGPQ
ncbi:MAG TPA: hypothetical protein VGN38_04740 [Caulobacteraceae bacterium]|nr:hypothetical protein [Caulobacteraceae bacterium]